MARLSWAGWLAIHQIFRNGSWTPDTVIHPSTKRVRLRRRVTSLIETNALPLSQSASRSELEFVSANNQSQATWADNTPPSCQPLTLSNKKPSCGRESMRYSALFANGFIHETTKSWLRSRHRWIYTLLSLHFVLNLFRILTSRSHM